MLNKALISLVGLFLSLATNASTLSTCEVVLKSVRILDNRPVTSEILNSFSARQARSSRAKVPDTDLKSIVFIFVDATPEQVKWVNRITVNRASIRAIVLNKNPEAPQQALAETLRSLLPGRKDKSAPTVSHVIIFNGKEDTEATSHSGVRITQVATGNALFKFMSAVGWPLSRTDYAAIVLSARGEKGLIEEGYSEAEIKALRNFIEN